MSKKKNKRVGVVYSTNPNYDYTHESDEEEETPGPSQQRLRVLLDRKKRKGKEVTLVTGFKGHSQDLKDLGKELKSSCGVGGTVKDGEILLQGNHVKRVCDLLIDKGYSQTKISGGY